MYNVVAVTDNAGDLQERMSYKPYGAPDTDEAPSNPDTSASRIMLEFPPNAPVASVVSAEVPTGTPEDALSGRVSFARATRGARAEHITWSDGDAADILPLLEPDVPLGKL